ncbi:MAG: coproporphyrinogen-III oxidase family protein [Nanobdellota archaeon]
MKNIIRKVLSDDAEFKFKKCQTFNLDKNREYGLYVHIPFCKNSCPYCPYFKTIYNKQKSKQFLKALKKEVELTSINNGNIKVNSLYFGGGTPTLLENDLIKIIEYLKSKFNISGEVAIETSPSDLNEEKLISLKKAGVNSISIGIQSFNNDLLKEIGRNYNSDLVIEIIKLLKKINFETLNIDMMFALPKQTINDLENDLDTLINLSPSQVTFYPLFTFPYTSVGKYKKIKKIKMPNFFTRKKMYYLICNKMKEAGYEQSSVWAFKKKSTNKFSSVTRDFYIGFGPSSGSYTGKNFYFNTFSLENYFKLSNKRKPVILKMSVDKKLTKLFWLYWRFYETKIPFEDYKRLFNSDVKEDFRFIFLVMKLLGFIYKENKDYLQLNMKGIFYIHLIQNIFALDYVNKIWSVCQKEINPKEVQL